MAQPSSTSYIIARLDLKPHPEGGHYRETFRDSRLDSEGRACSTAILFLLARGERSHWHRIDAVEVWHYHAGDPRRKGGRHRRRGHAAAFERALHFRNMSRAAINPPPAIRMAAIAILALALA